MFLLWLWYMMPWIAGRRYGTFVLACMRPPHRTIGVLFLCGFLIVLPQQN